MSIDKKIYNILRELALSSAQIKDMSLIENFLRDYYDYHIFFMEKDERNWNEKIPKVLCMQKLMINLSETLNQCHPQID